MDNIINLFAFVLNILFNYPLFYLNSSLIYFVIFYHQKKDYFLITSYKITNNNS